MTRTRAAGRRALQWILKTLEASNRPMSVSEIADDIEAAGGPALDPRQVAYRITQASDLITPTGGKSAGRGTACAPRRQLLRARLRSKPRRLPKSQVTSHTERSAQIAQPEAPRLRHSIVPFLLEHTHWRMGSSPAQPTFERRPQQPRGRGHFPAQWQAFPPESGL